MPTPCLGQGVSRSEACPSMPVPSWLQVCLCQNHADSLTLIVAVCVAGIDKLLQAVCLPGNLQEQGDGVILPIVQVEHGFQQTGLPRLRVCRTKWESEKGAAQGIPGIQPSAGLPLNSLSMRCFLLFCRKSNRLSSSWQLF